MNFQIRRLARASASLSSSLSMALSIAIGAGTFGAGCAKGAGFSSGETQDAASLALESAVGATSGAANDSEQNSNYALAIPSSRTALAYLSDWALPSAYAATPCGISRFSPAIGSANCVGGAVMTATFNSCTAGPSSEFTLSGLVTLTFDAAGTCNTFVSGTVPATGSVTRTMTSFKRTNPGGSFVTTSSNVANNYLSVSIGGGVQTNFTGVGDARSIGILGLHRTLTGARGHTIFDHSVHTTAPIVLSGTLVGANRTITSGTVVVDHNLAAYTTTVNLAGLGWGQVNCCHPTVGTITATYSGSLAGTSISADFATGTCGTVSVATNGGTPVLINLTSCE